ncbi:MerR family transcriptional regulator [Paucibacter sp. AS339]|uniref:MerR family transcriptional regulator n=1 Tax=Paucibacter hankyongi TaxID=3133434 RepID=UPI0030A518DD
MSEGMLIGQICRLTGASAKAVRLYEAMGLLPQPRRRGKYRVFEQEHVDAVALIRQAQVLGFKLNELKQLASQGPLVEAVSLAFAREAVAQRRQDLALQILALQAQAGRLEAFAATLAGAHELACACPQLQLQQQTRKKSATGA